MNRGLLSNCSFTGIFGRIDGWAVTFAVGESRGEVPRPEHPRPDATRCELCSH